MSDGDICSDDEKYGGFGAAMANTLAANSTVPARAVGCGPIWTGEGAAAPFIDRSARLLVGGPAQKMTFFQVVQKSFLSVPIYCTRCKYDSLDFFFKNIAWNLSVECVKHENVGYGRFSSRFLPGF